MSWRARMEDLEERLAILNRRSALADLRINLLLDRDAYRPTAHPTFAQVCQ